jgi:phosphohistidine phosphatase
LLKTVLLFRHAKSSRDDPEAADFDRPLSKRGRRDGPRMGKWMHEAGMEPDLVLCSDARRARETWNGVSQTLRSAAPVLFERGLYLASAKVVLNRLRRLTGNVNSVLVIGHNPGLEEAAQALSDHNGEPFERLRRKFPTAGLARLDFKIDDWSKLEPGTGRLSLMVTPADVD